jgi:2,5-diketo-D-gluconate reductase A
MADAIASVALSGGGQMPMLGLGTWELRGVEAYRAVRVALDVGYRHIDTAAFYENEVEVGRAVADSGVPRNDLFLTTKLAPNDVGRERSAIETSLRNLATEYVDLWLVHHPPESESAAACWEGFVAARERGLAHEIGVSNHSVEAIDRLAEAFGVLPAVHQVRWGTTTYDPALLAAHRRRGVVLMGYHPFKASDLEHPVILAIAARHRISAARAVLRWHIQHGVPTIPKSRRADRIAANFDLQGFVLSESEMAEIDGTSTRRS